MGHRRQSSAPLNPPPEVGCPVVVGAPDHTAPEAALEGGSSGRMMSAEADAYHADPVGIDARNRLKIVDARGGRDLCFRKVVQAVLAERFPDAGIVHDQGRTPRSARAVGNPVRKRNSLIPSIP